MELIWGSETARRLAKSEKANESQVQSQTAMSRVTIRQPKEQINMVVSVVGRDTLIEIRIPTVVTVELYEAVKKKSGQQGFATLLERLICVYGSGYQVPRTRESRTKEEGKIVELDCTAHSKARALIAELESTIRFLEEQNINERQECHSATLQLRRSERRAEKHNLRVKQMRRELDEQEEEMTRERARSRNLQRKIDELTRANEMLTRENNRLRARAENRENMRLYQILRSSDSLGRNNAEEGDAGNEDSYISSFRIWCAFFGHSMEFHESERVSENS
ncbi:hypothetical protein ANCCEY_00100 [Ancylostoma ceylanicum]|uniref:Uncharacterized protein n=1 Tax=Ancylostoma ceylanicum TaxID=53326 RepID=A0A0D6MAX3_9BILA|nr:hypothetical protein ANCCEY_00100 [Ancylostoma ceylanicum]